MKKKEKKEEKKKLKPRGIPFAKGNKLKYIANTRRKLVEFRSAIEYIAQEGMGIKEACEKAGIQIKHFYRIKNSDPRLVKVYYEALRQRSDMDVEKVREDVLTCNKDTAFPAKVKTDYIKWHAGKVNPEVYGDVDNRPPVNLEIKIGGELLTVSGAGGSKK